MSTCSNRANVAQSASDWLLTVPLSIRVTRPVVALRVMRCARGLSAPAPSGSGERAGHLAGEVVAGAAGVGGTGKRLVDGQ
jgi:hypothetical protein